MYTGFVRVSLLAIFSLLVAIILALLTGCAQTQSPPLSLPQTQNQPLSDKVINQWLWRPSPGNIVTENSLAYLPPKGAYVIAGHTLTLSWQSDNNIECFILAEKQFKIAINNRGFISNSLAFGSGGSGSIRAIIPVSDTYYGLVRNSLAGNSIKLYQATLSEQD